MPVNGDTTFARILSSEAGAAARSPAAHWRRVFTSAAAAFAALAVGCAGKPGRPPVGPEPGETTAVSEKPSVAAKRRKANKADVASVVEGNNAFAFNLYAKLRGKKGNLVFSPYSVSTALAMTYAGARGETAAQMEKVLHFTLGQENLHPAMADVVDDLNTRGGEGVYELVVANRLWGQKGYRFLDPFLKLNSTYYGAGLEQVDFARATDAARKTINAWVEDKTRDKIKELLKPGILDRLTTLVLTNAIYFKGNWASQFDRKHTREAPFRLTASKKINVQMMYHKASKFRTGRFPRVHLLELPYVGDDLSMVILLPDEVDGLAQVEKSLTTGNLTTWLARLREQKIAVSLPRFKITFGLDLAEVLASMGMPDAFSLPPADFSGMDGTRSLYISKVIHKAFVDVNEEGTEAAAATAVVMTRSAPPVFRADHPFMFLIRDRKTGGILFIGRVMNPT